MRKGAKIIPFNKLKRSGAIRELEGKVDVSHGHKFVSKRFYQILRCSVCRDFNVNITYQCEGKSNCLYSCHVLTFILDCHLSCHKNCYDRVPSRCLARESISPVVGYGLLLMAIYTDYLGRMKVVSSTISPIDLKRSW